VRFVRIERSTELRQITSTPTSQAEQVSPSFPPTSFKIVKQSGEIAARRKINASNDNKVILTKALRVSVLRSIPSTLRRAHPTLIADESEVLIALEAHFRPRNE